MPNDCKPQLQACALRVARLDGAGVPNPGNSNLYVTTAFTTVGFSAEVAEGEEFEVKNACGEVCVSYKDCDRLKRLNMDIELCYPDPELTEMLVGGVRLVSGAATGYGFPRLNVADCPNGISIEIWAKRITTGGSLASPFPYAWWVFPKVFLQHNEDTFENGPHQPTFAGFAIENENWYNGPSNNWPVASDRVAQWMPTSTLPPDICGYQQLAAS